MLKKLKFYFIGFIPGIIIVLFILNQKGASCSYFPNDRVIAETLSKNFSYSDSFKAEMTANQLTEQFVKDSMISKGKIIFDKSNTQKEPCPEYLISYPTKNPKYEAYYTKCKEGVTFQQLKKLR